VKEPVGERDLVCIHLFRVRDPY